MSEEYYIIDRKYYWEESLKNPENITLYRFNGSNYTKRQLRGISSSWGTGYKVGNHHYTKQSLEHWLSEMEAGSSSACTLSGERYNKQQLEDILNITQSPAACLPSTFHHADSTRNLNDYSSSEITETLSTDGMDTPRALEDEDGEDEDEAVTKVLANLQAKIEAIKQYKSVAVEVDRLRKLLAEKEAEFAECKRVLSLESKQV